MSIETTSEPDRGQVLDMVVIEAPAVAAAAIDPLRSRILACLAEPGSATTVAATTGETRQKVNYHLRALEAQGLVREVGTRARRGLTERIVQASARSYLLSPTVLGENAAEPERVDRLSAAYLAAVAARMVSEVGELSRLAAEAGKTLATMTIDTDLRFASADDRAAFTEELAAAVTSLVAKYHDEEAPNGRTHRLVVGSHPMPPVDSAPDPRPETRARQGSLRCGNPAQDPERKE